MRYLILNSVFIGFILTCGLIAGESYFETIRSFKAAEAKQGVAVDQDHIYVISSQKIGKYDKKTLQKVASWQGAEKGPILHLDSGVIFKGKLYCAHSNYPHIPMTSSVEIWDAASLEHIESFSFGVRWGSCTWIDRHRDSWWATFAHYDRFAEATHKDNRWTILIRFDDTWQPRQSWIFPPQVLQRMKPMSNSGGSWGGDDFLYCSGHDRPEIYCLRLPDSGSVLELVDIIPIENQGQGIAWDRSQQNILYAIHREHRQVIEAKYLNDRLQKKKEKQK